MLYMVVHAVHLSGWVIDSGGCSDNKRNHSSGCENIVVMAELHYILSQSIYSHSKSTFSYFFNFILFYETEYGFYFICIFKIL